MKSSVCMGCDGGINQSRGNDGAIITQSCKLCPGNHIITEADDAAVTFYPNLVVGKKITLPKESAIFVDDPEICGEQMTDEQYRDIFDN